MQYLGGEYLLQTVTDTTYISRAKRCAYIKMRHTVEDMLRLVLPEENPELSLTISETSLHLMEVYGEGGGHFCNGIAASISALRKTNPLSIVPSIEPEDWDRTAEREAELRSRPAITTLEGACGIGLLEVRDVNPTYVDGYQEIFGLPALTPYLGFTGLGALMAHDLMHFASQRGQQ
jgi:hypothetical protein